MLIRKFLCVFTGVLLLTSTCFADAYDAPVGYYNSATGQGATLKSQLVTLMTLGPDGVVDPFPIFGDDQIQRTYGDFRNASKLFDADPAVPGNILLVYNRASNSGTWDSGATWNREHVWPQSLQPGSANNSSTGHLGDHHALRPANPGINSSRSNRPFGDLASSGSFGIQGSGNYFPGEADKGDIARQLFYSDTRYDSTLTDLSTGLVGDINTLIHWNYADVPDDFERRRNHVIYSKVENPVFFTNNRNAYIDHPEYVWSVFGGGNNDSQLSVGAGPAADGSSTATVDLGRVIVGQAVPAAQTVSLTKTGVAPTYYDVTAAGDATSTVNGRFNAFTGGAGGTSIDVGVTDSTAAAGLLTGTVVVDNIDISTGGTGQGSADANDTITANLNVLDHANASFVSGLDQNMLTIDFGTLSVGGVVNSAFDLFNLEQTLGFTADLDLDSILGAGDTGVLSSDLSAFGGLVGGSSSGFLASFDTSVAGVFSATYTLNLSDEDIAGATNQVLTLQLLGEVAGLLAGDFDGSGFVGIDDLNILLANWNTTVTAGDLTVGDADGSGFIGVDDLNILLANWNAGTLPPLGSVIPEPGSLVLLSLGGFAVLSRRRP